MAAIYGLADPETGEVRYIGKANDPAKRLSSHMRDSRRRDTPVYRWIRKNGRPALVILVDQSSDWKADERRLIAEGRERGDRLLNVADGGDEPFCPPETLRANARMMNDTRPPNLMRAYRIMESTIRSLQGLGSSRVLSLQEKFARFKDSVARARTAGTLNDLDEALGIWLAQKQSAGRQTTVTR